MPREYICNFEQISVSAPQDLFQLKGASGKMLRVKRVAVGATDTTAPTSQMLAVRCRFLGATVSDGSGGSSGVAPKAVDPGDAAASFTYLANNTSKATSSGTVNILEENSCHVLAGYDYSFPFPPLIGPSESFVFELLSTVSGTVHLSGTALVEELGG